MLGWQLQQKDNWRDLFAFSLEFFLIALFKLIFLPFGFILTINLLMPILIFWFFISDKFTFVSLFCCGFLLDLILGASLGLHSFSLLIICGLISWLKDKIVWQQDWHKLLFLASFSLIHQILLLFCTLLLKKSIIIPIFFSGFVFNFIGWFVLLFILYILHGESFKRVDDLSLNSYTVR